MNFKPIPYYKGPSYLHKKRRILWLNSSFNSGFTLIDNKVYDVFFDLPPLQIYKNSKLKVVSYTRDSNQSRPIVIKLKDLNFQRNSVMNTDNEYYPVIYSNHTGVEGITFTNNPSITLIPQQIPRITLRLDDNYTKLGYLSYFSSLTNGSIFQVSSNPNGKYITFNSNGSFVLDKNLICDILVVGGGGGGGGDMGGGGGGGGVVYQRGVSLSTGSYSVIVGAGGNGAPIGGINQGSITFNSVDGSVGSDSKIQFGGIDLTIGGITYVGKGGGGGGNYDAGGTYNGTPGTAGGSGGGAGGGFTLTSGGGSATQGNTYNNDSTNVAGGYAGSARIGQQISGFYAGGGGGGAGGIPKSGSQNGNPGVQISITGTNSWYASGGGGGVIRPNTNSKVLAGVGGNGIGGDGHLGLQSGAVVTTATKHNGTNGTGAGGGGGVMYYNTGTKANEGGNGGSGIVIIRFNESRIEGITAVDNKPPPFILGLQIEDE